jgi:hypothetical protein
MKFLLLSFFFCYLFFAPIWTFGFQIDKKQLVAKIQKTDADLVKALKANNFREAVKLAKQNGENYVSLEKPSIAEKYYKNAIVYATKANDKKLEAYAYEVEGDFISPKAALKRKLKNYEVAEKLYREIGSAEGAASIKRKLIKHSFEQKQYEATATHGKLLLDSISTFAVNEFEKLTYCKALIVAFGKLNKPQELKKYIDLLGTINMQAVSITKLRT